MFITTIRIILLYLSTIHLYDHTHAVVYNSNTHTYAINMYRLSMQKIYHIMYFVCISSIIGFCDVCVYGYTVCRCSRAYLCDDVCVQYRPYHRRTPCSITPFLIIIIYMRTRDDDDDERERE